MTVQECVACGFESPVGFNFCGNCGARLTTQGGEPGHADATTPRPERRQLTVLFCDLVGSTELSQQLDPEDLRKVIRGYQAASEPVIERYGGFVSRFLGDGILAFFGYPQAHEDDAERAVHAGLGLIDAVTGVDWLTRIGQPLQTSVRVGIATGLVVAGDLIGKGGAEEEAIVGETPNLAARLQALASPNTVLVGSRTQRLAQGSFRYQSLGKHMLKGFAAPQEVWRVEASLDTSTRFEAMRASDITPIVDRYEEQQLLQDRWNTCKSGKPQVVLISGEPGIGKSRLTQALRDHVSHEPHFYLRYQCSPYHVNTALHPIAAHFERAAGIERHDSATEKREKLRAVLRLSGTDEDKLLPPFAAMLSIPSGDDDAFDRLSARAKKLATINALFDQIFGLANTRPVLAVVEDVHWSDPSSLEVLQSFIRESTSARLMVVLTYRSESTIQWQDLPNAYHLQLSRLDASYSTDIVNKVAGDAALSTDIVELIVAKTDGVPLFVEELTKTLLTSGVSESGTQAPADSTLPTAIPDTLQDSLMARLDQLGLAKRVAQIGAVIGRQFTHDLIDQVADLQPDQLRDALATLSASGLIFTDGYPPRAIYTFKHALVRDTAYGSLLREERRDLHRRIAESLVASNTPVAPELLARHYTEAGLDDQAIDYWLRSGQSASQRSANLEAVVQLQQGLALLQRQPPSERREHKRLEFLINLGPPLIATRGSGSSATEDVYREAVGLTETLPESEDHFAALWGWWRISKNFQTKAARAAKLQALAERLDDDGLKLQAHHCQWATRFHLGDHSACQHHVDAGLQLYADRDYRSHASRYGGHDPRVCALGETAQSLWLTGYPQKAQDNMRRARVWAEELKQSGSLAHVMDMNLLLLRYRREPEGAARQACELARFADENQFPEYTAKAEVFRGWALAKSGRAQEGLALMREGIESHDIIGTNEDPPVWLEMLADGYLEQGSYQDGLDAIDEAFRHAEQSGLTFWVAELHRCRGALLQHIGEAYWDQACACFQQAIDISVAQGARMLQLRASVAMALNAKRRGDIDAALNHLTALMEQFDEGFDTPDWQDAQAVRRALAGRDS